MMANEKLLSAQKNYINIACNGNKVDLCRRLKQVNNS